jgi:CRP/FNR family transcriptional regulator, cyclic AMP receptor protein
MAMSGQRRHFAAGEVLIRQGDVSDCMYVLLQGQVRVERAHPDLHEPLHLADLPAGTTVGEIGVLDGGNRTATVTAVEPTETLRLPAGALAGILQAHPETAAALLHILSKRLRNTDELIDETLRRKQLQEVKDR